MSSFDAVPRLNHAQQVHSLQMSGGGGPPFVHGAFSPPPHAMPNGMLVAPPPFSPVDRGMFGLPSPNAVPMMPPYMAQSRPWVHSPVQMISSPRNAFSPDPYMFSVDFNRLHEQPMSIWNGINEQKKPEGKKSKVSTFEFCLQLGAHVFIIFCETLSSLKSKYWSISLAGSSSKVYDHTYCK